MVISSPIAIFFLAEIAILPSMMVATAFGLQEWFRYLARFLRSDPSIVHRRLSSNKYRDFNCPADRLEIRLPQYRTMKQCLPIASIAKRPSPVAERLTRNLAGITSIPHETSAPEAILRHLDIIPWFPVALAQPTCDAKSSASLVFLASVVVSYPAPWQAVAARKRNRQRSRLL
jgi:hypothetical protein